MKIITFGDIHGQDIWKTRLFGGNHEFEVWKGAKELPDIIKNVDKIIFVGDFVDSFTINNKQMIINLQDIIRLKKELPDKIVLLFGNHDISYLYEDERVSGYRPEIALTLNKIYTDNFNLFQIAYQYKNFIWTHAGISKQWYNNFVNENIIKYEIDTTNMNIADELNEVFKFKPKELFTYPNGPIWIRPEMLTMDLMDGYTQIVGHTPQNEITTYSYKNSALIIVDVLEYTKEKEYLQLNNL